MQNFLYITFYSSVLQIYCISIVTCKIFSLCIVDFSPAKLKSSSLAHMLVGCCVKHELNVLNR